MAKFLSFSKIDGWAEAKHLAEVFERIREDEDASWEAYGYEERYASSEIHVSYSIQIFSKIEDVAGPNFIVDVTVGDACDSIECDTYIDAIAAAGEMSEHMNQLSTLEQEEGLLFDEYDFDDDEDFEEIDELEQSEK